MNLELSRSFERSYSILNKLQKQKIEGSEKWIAGLWINGREEGITLTNYNDKFKIIFCESRNSDAMVVYYGREDGFEDYFEMITEETYKKAIYLDDDNAVIKKILFLMKIENWI